MRRDISSQQLEDWMNHNPLRLWRKEYTLGLYRASQRLDVSPSSITAWESGRTIPSRKSIHHLAQKLQRPDLEKQWQDWLAARPDMTEV